MLSHRRESFRLRLEVGDGLIAASALVGAAALRGSDLLAELAFLGPLPPADDLFLCAAIAGLASTRALRWSGAYSDDCFGEVGGSLGRLFRGCAFGALGLLVVGLAFGLHSLDAALLALFAPIHLAGLALWRWAASGVLNTAGRSERSPGNFVVIGSDARARGVGAELTGRWGFRNLGFLDDAPLSRDVEALGSRYLGHAKELRRIVESETVDEVIVVLPRQQLGADSTREAIRLCEAVGLDITLVSDLFDSQRSKLGCHEALGSPALSLRSYSLPPTWALAIKRGVDLVGASLALALTLPLWVAVAIAIKLDSRGPVFFVQRRCGLHGRPFPFLKFRTMVPQAERQLARLRDHNEQSGPVFKIKRDPRVTRVGRLLRKYSIDELPQLLNVLAGQMSLVGPRPPIPGEVHQYEIVQRRRLSMRPGITCLWQVNGRSLLQFDEWVRLDLEYIDRWSLWLDVKILLKTVPAVLSARGAS